MIDTPEKQIEAPQPESEDTSTRKVWWIVGGSITGAVLLTAMTFFGAWIWSVSSPEETASYNEEFTQAVTGVDVAVEVGDIELNASGGDALVVDREARWRGSEPEIVEQRHGDTFTAVGNCDDGMFSFGGDKCEVDYTIALPSGAAAEANNDIGEIHLDGLDGAIDVETSVGDIDGENLRATETKVESSVGSIELEFDRGPRRHQRHDEHRRRRDRRARRRHHVRGAVRVERRQPEPRHRHLGVQPRRLRHHRGHERRGPQRPLRRLTAIPPQSATGLRSRTAASPKPLRPRRFRQRRVSAASAGRATVPA